MGGWEELFILLKQINQKIDACFLFLLSFPGSVRIHWSSRGARNSWGKGKAYRLGGGQCCPRGGGGTGETWAPFRKGV